MTDPPRQTPGTRTAPRQVAVIALALTIGMGYGSAVRADVLIIASETGAWASEVQQTLTNAGILAGPIDIFDARVANPSLSLLQGYEAVLVYANTAFNNPNSFANTLATYVDGGGGVVQAGLTHVNPNGPNGGPGLGGRWRAQGYGPWAPGPVTSGTQLSLGSVIDPLHPIMNNVTSFDGGSGSWHNQVGSLTSGSQLIARWSNGEDLVAVNSSRAGTVVGLNFFPPSDLSRADFWDAGSSGALLLSNALVFVGATAKSVPEPSGVLLLSFLAVGATCGGIVRRCRQGLRCASCRVQGNATESSPRLGGLGSRTH